MGLKITVFFFASALLAAFPVFGDYAPPNCYDYGSCQTHNFDVEPSACWAAIGEICDDPNLGKKDAILSQGPGSEEKGNCVAGYAVPSSGVRVGSAQDCHNTFNAILNSCAPPAQFSTRGFGGAINWESKTEPEFFIWTAASKFAGHNLCVGSNAHGPGGAISTEESAAASGRRFGVAGAALAGSHPGKEKRQPLAFEA